MNEEHRKLLRSKTRFINSNLVVHGPFLDYLHEKGILTVDMVQEIEYQNRSSDVEKEELKNFNRSVGHQELAQSNIANVHHSDPPAPTLDHFESYDKDTANSCGDNLKTEGVQSGSVNSIDNGNADLDVKLTQVDETDRFIRDLLSDTENVYKMNSNPRGLAVIFSNEYFWRNLKEREGSTSDLRNLNILFKHLGFSVQEYKDQTADAMRSSIKQLSRPKDSTHKDSCAFILCCLSHGVEGKIFGVDEDYLEIQKDIIDPFDGNNCEDLRGKPKVFIFQACQGKESTSGVLCHDGISDVDTVFSGLNLLEVEDRQGQAGVPSNNLYIHEKADIFQIYATVEGYKAYRHPVIGSWFVRAIVLVFQENCHKEHLLDMLQMVSRQVSKLQTGYNVQKNEGKFLQQPSFKGSMNKKLYFFPGYKYDI